MNPKSDKPLRLFNPLSIWTDFALKSGGAMLDAAQAAITRPRPKVAVIPDAAPPKAAAPAPLSKSARKARKNASSRAKRRGR